MKQDIWIHHGATNHAYSERLKCDTCLEAEKEYKQAIAEAGSLKKFIKQEKQKLDR